MGPGLSESSHKRLQASDNMASILLQLIVQRAIQRFGGNCYSIYTSHGRKGVHTLNQRNVTRKQKTEVENSTWAVRMIRHVPSPRLRILES